MTSDRLVDFEKVLSAVPLESVLARYGALERLRRSGTNRLRGPCPIHQGTNKDQFIVDLAKNLWRCWSPQCDRGGNAISFVVLMEGGIEYRNAAQLISDWYGLTSPKLKPAIQPKEKKMAEKSSTPSNAPTHRAYTVRGEGDDAFWVRIGSAWPNKDGKGFNLLLDALPIDGRIVLREPSADEAEEPPKKGRK